MSGRSEDYKCGNFFVPDGQALVGYNFEQLSPAQKSWNATVTAVPVYEPSQANKMQVTLLSASCGPLVVPVALRVLPPALPLSTSDRYAFRLTLCSAPLTDWQERALVSIRASLAQAEASLPDAAPMVTDASDAMRMQ